MMEEFVRECESKGIRLRYVGGNLSYTGPQSALSDEIINTMRNMKPQLLEFLKHYKPVPPEIPGLIIKPYGDGLFYFPDPNKTV